MKIVPNGDVRLPGSRSFAIVALVRCVTNNCGIGRSILAGG